MNIVDYVMCACGSVHILFESQPKPTWYCRRPRPVRYWICDKGAATNRLTKA